MTLSTNCDLIGKNDLIGKSLTLHEPLGECNLSTSKMSRVPIKNEKAVQLRVYPPPPPQKNTIWNS